MEPSNQARNFQTKLVEKSFKTSEAIQSAKQVRFSDNSTLILTSPKSAREHKMSWYSKTDFEDFERKAARSVQSVLTRNPNAAKAYITKTFLSHDSNRFTGIEQVCGIEHGLSPEVNRALLMARSKVMQGVLREQALQEEAGETNLERMAAVSKRASVFPKLWRHRVAVLNASN